MPARRLSIALVLAGALALSGCGGVEFADLFLVTRSGTEPGAKLTLLVNDDGTARCNGGPRHMLSSKQLLAARALQRALFEPARLKLMLASRPGSILRYRVKTQDGMLSFADNSRGLTPALSQVQSLTRNIAIGACGLVR